MMIQSCEQKNLKKDAMRGIGRALREACKISCTIYMILKNNTQKIRNS